MLHSVAESTTFNNEIADYKKYNYFRALLARVLFLNAKTEKEASESISQLEMAKSKRAKAVKLMEALMPLGNSSQAGKLFWSTGKDNKARDVELTAYMVLNLVSQSKLSGNPCQI